jgi:hypothetical protein
LSDQKSQIKNQKWATGDPAPSGTKQRISACRKRLRRTRAMRRAQDLERDEAVVAARELLALAREDGDFGEPENDFEEAAAPKLAAAARQFTPEVDRRPRLRAR